jgi:hypothetical protein
MGIELHIEAQQTHWNSARAGDACTRDHNDFLTLCDGKRNVGESTPGMRVSRTIRELEGDRHRWREAGGTSC